MPDSESPPPRLVLSEAKLAPPRPRVGLLARPRLFTRLDELDDVALTLVSAPAGSGKTVAVASWLQSRSERSVAWVSLEHAEDEPVRLWTAVATSVDRLRPGIARPALATLRTPRHDIEMAIDELLNGLAGFAGQVVIVLDDLHHVSSDTGLRSVAYAVERLPHTTRIVATTRSDPAIRLGRLRARGDLGELRVDSLAFTVDEVAEFLERQGVTPLLREDVELLAERTEGWPAWIGLAGMWLANTEAPQQHLREFSASNRHVTDYLTTEVLDTLDEDTRSFLLRTSVLGRFSAELWDWVLEADGSAARLDGLARSNLFLVPLDGRGEWYRYHHLFRELLLAELAGGDSAAPARLHQRAADWFEQRAMYEDALEHTTLAGGGGVLADLLLKHHFEFFRTATLDTFMRWLPRVPDAELASRPVLSAAGALASGMLAQPAPIRKRYAALAEGAIIGAPEPVRIYVQAVAALTRGGLLDGDLDVALEDVRIAAGLARADVPLLVVGTLGVLSYIEYLAGDEAAAEAAAVEALARPEAVERPHGMVYAHAVHALLESAAGLHEAAAVEARVAVGYARELGLAGTWSAGIAHHALGEALLGLGRLADAERELMRARELRQAVEPRLDTVHTLIQLARVRVARGRLTLAGSTLGSAYEQLNAFDEAGRLPELAAEVDQALTDALAGNDAAVEPPTPAELSILQLLGSDMSQRDIGEQLFLSLNTVKTHSRNLYAKLGAHSREEAVQRAYALGLIDHQSSAS